MSSSFPQFSVDEIVFRYGSQDSYFMIIHNIQLNQAHILLLCRQYYILVLSFTEPFPGKFRNNFFVNQNFLEQYSGTFRNSGTTFQKFPVLEKNRTKIVLGFRISGTFSKMEMKKNSESIPYVSRNPEFRICRSTVL